MKYGLLFATVSTLLAAAALLHRGWQLLWLWPAVSFGVIAIGYLGAGPKVYGKSTHGVLSPFSQLLLLPYLLYLWTVWHVLRLVKREPAWHQLTDKVIIGRRLRSRELPCEIDHVVDLTCEFTEPSVLRSRSYRLYPVLDGVAPSPEQFRQWVSEVAALPGIVYIHCAEGHGRTGMFAAALLLARGEAKSAEEALAFVKSKRPLVRLGRQQVAALRALEKAA